MSQNEENNLGINMISVYLILKKLTISKISKSSFSFFDPHEVIGIVGVVHLRRLLKFERAGMIWKVVVVVLKMSWGNVLVFFKCDLFLVT